MNRWAKVAAVAGGGLVATAGAVAAGTLMWNRATARAIRRLDTSHGGEHVAEVGRFSREQLEGLPPPVARYFEFALPPGQRLVRRAHLRFKGSFAVRPGTWSPFTAAQTFTVSPPGFVWDAKIAMVPLVPVRVRDSYVGGEGAMLAKTGALMPMVNQHGTPEMAAGSLMRYVAEAAWFPTALLPGDGLSWTPVDDTSARVTLVDGATTVSLDVRFAPGGDITGFSAMRGRDVNGVDVPTLWVGRHTEWKRVHGMMIPTAGEVGWVLPEGEAPYWRGRVVDATYEL